MTESLFTDRPFLDFLANQGDELIQREFITLNFDPTYFLGSGRDIYCASTNLSAEMSYF